MELDTTQSTRILQQNLSAVVAILSWLLVRLPFNLVVLESTLFTEDALRWFLVILTFGRDAKDHMRSSCTYPGGSLGTVFDVISKQNSDF